MSDTYAPSAAFAANAHADKAKYDEMYAASIADPEAFWGEEGKRLARRLIFVVFAACSMSRGRGAVRSRRSNNYISPCSISKFSTTPTICIYSSSSPLYYQDIATTTAAAKCVDNRMWQ